MRYGIGTYFALLAGVAALSASAIFVKLAQAPSAVAAFYRLAFAALVLLPVLLFRRADRRELRGLTRAQGLRIILSGLLLAVHYGMWFASLELTSVSSSTVLVALQPLFSLAFGRIFLKEKLSKNAVAGCLVAIAGSAVVGWGDFQVSPMALLGDGLALAAAAVIALYFLVGQVVRTELGALSYSVVSYGSAAAFLLAYVLLSGDALQGYTVQTWGAFWGLAVISTVGGQFVFNLLLKHVSASSVTMSILGEPVGTCILAYFILHESIAPRQLAGIAVILAGLCIFFFCPRNSKGKTDAPEIPAQETAGKGALS